MVNTAVARQRAPGGHGGETTLRPVSPAQPAQQSHHSPSFSIKPPACPHVVPPTAPSFSENVLPWAASYPPPFPVPMQKPPVSFFGPVLGILSPPLTPSRAASSVLGTGASPSRGTRLSLSVLLYSLFLYFFFLFSLSPSSFPSQACGIPAWRSAVPNFPESSVCSLLRATSWGTPAAASPPGGHRDLLWACCPGTA